MENYLKNIDELKQKIDNSPEIKFKIKVIANSKKNSIEFNEDYIKIKIKQRAVENKANKAIIEYLSEILSIAKSKIIIFSGEKSSLKVIKISN